MTAGLDHFDRHLEALPALRRQLMREFEGSVPLDRVDEAAEKAITSFGEVKVRAYVPILALRRAREFLRRSPRANSRVGGSRGRE